MRARGAGERFGGKEKVSARRGHGRKRRETTRVAPAAIVSAFARSRAPSLQSILSSLPIFMYASHGTPMCCTILRIPDSKLEWDERPGMHSPRWRPARCYKIFSKAEAVGGQVLAPSRERRSLAGLGGDEHFECSGSVRSRSTRVAIASSASKTQASPFQACSTVTRA